ncbi:MAG TPA: RidA family protein [Verrucomicrobiae bacterium]|jgi:2-iminobutanoate/2-iminopropanoate deaminase|nr:RidA family protein [Verrucomicrobiae bacterium]
MSPRAVTGKTLGPPLGMYSHGMIAGPGELVVVAGQVGMRDGEVVGAGDVGAQTRQALANVDAVLKAAGVSMRDVVRLQTFLTSAADIDGFMTARRAAFPAYFPDGVFPPNTLLVISRLVHPELLVEIEAMAVKPAAAAPAARAAAAVRAISRKAKPTGRRPARRHK